MRKALSNFASKEFLSCLSPSLQRTFSLANSMASPSKLSEVIKLDLIENKRPDEITSIWMEFHEDPEKKRVATVLPADQFNVLVKNASLSRMFVLPLGKPREEPKDGSKASSLPEGQQPFLTLMVQQQMPFTLISTLEEFRRYGPNAPAHMVITHYRELSHTKGLVLVRGDVINEKLISVPEARTVLALVHAFYTDPQSYELVKNFNHQPDKFEFNDLLKKCGF